MAQILLGDPNGDAGCVRVRWIEQVIDSGNLAALSHDDVPGAKPSKVPRPASAPTHLRGVNTGDQSPVPYNLRDERIAPPAGGRTPPPRFMAVIKRQIEGGESESQ
jgi:hypothetical protein